MHKRLLKLFALIMLPVFLVACEHGTESKVDKDILAKTLQEAMDTAKELDNLNMKAFGMARVGMGMATVDPEKAAQTLNEALMLARQARSRKYMEILGRLKSTTAEWPAAEKDQVADAIDRIEKGTTRVWVVRAIAEGIMINDKNSAGQLLMSAASAATLIPDPKYRDLDLRSLAALMAGMNVEAAEAIAGEIHDPRLAAWALTEIGRTAASSGTGDPAMILGKAADAARRIPGTAPESSPLLVEEASAEAKEMVLGAEAAKMAAEGARALAAVAVAMDYVDHAAARRLADEAVGMAMAINDKKYAYTRAYGLSDVTMEIAKFDASKAAGVIDNIDAKHADARVAAMLAVMNARSGSANSSNMLSEISSALVIAESMTDDYDRIKAMAALARLAIPYSKEKAAEIAGEIEEELGHETYAYSNLKNDVLADVAVAWVGEDDDMAKKILNPTVDEAGKDHGRYVVEPRFCKDMVLRTKAVAYMGMADKTIDSDQAAAMKLYTKAAGAAAEAKSTALQWKLAERMCRVDAGKLFDFAATISPGDFENQAEALTAIAEDWTGKGNPSSGMVWDMAAKTANMMGDNLESSAALNRVAAACAKYDKDKATAIYAMSMKRLAKIGMEEG